LHTQIYEIELQKKDDIINLEPLSDIHVGQVNFAKAKFEERLRAIETDPTRYWIGLGDFADAIIAQSGLQTDKRFSYMEVSREFLTPDEQYNKVREYFERIKTRGLGLHEGNHDWALADKTGHRYVLELARDLGLPYLGFSAFTLLRFRYNKKIMAQTRIFSGHSYYGGTKVGGNLNKLEELMTGFEADIYITGHTHNVIAEKRPVLTIDSRGKLLKVPKIFVSAGSFLESYMEGTDTYPEKRLLPAKKVGTVTISFHPAAQQVYVHE
jgi:UDP-2,3-diacylglucosamine pyrophosphatase LpxH